MKVTQIRHFINQKGESFVEALVDGSPLWFSSSDTRLTAAPEAFASALLIPAATKGEDLEFDPDACLDSKWFSNLPDIQNLLSEWWNLPKINIIANSIETTISTPTGKYAQCFTGGVDSYYELLSNPKKPDILLYIHGFDIALTDHERFEAFLVDLNATAMNLNCKPVVIKSNFRAHEALRNIKWGHSHGGAIVSAAHCMAADIDKLVIPSSYPYYDSHPWGSHWDLDPLWSSKSLGIEHADASMRRHGKIAAISSNHLVQNHLRVCWENRSPKGNCSRCEKCVRTMLAMELNGALKDCNAFDLSIPLAKRIKELDPVKGDTITIYEDFLSEIKDPLLKRQVENLITKSKRSLLYKSSKDKVRNYLKKLTGLAK